MIKKWKNRIVAFAPLLCVLGALTAFTGCGESEGPAEKAGKSVDKGIQDVQDAVNPPGAAEKAGRALDKATKP
jgi:hypothetical protein